MRNKKGFTLAEVLIVVVIIGVVAAMAIPKLFSQQEKAVADEAAAMLSSIRVGELFYRDRFGTFVQISNNTDPAWAKIGLDAPGSGDNVAFDYQVDQAAGIATATRTSRKRGNARFIGKSISIYLSNSTWSGDHPDTPKNTL